VRDLCYESLGPILDALVTCAAIPTKEGHQDRKLYLELIGEHVSGEKVHQEEKKKSDGLSDGEIVLRFEGKPHLLPPGVRRRLGLDPNTDPAALAVARATLAKAA